jgi:hypothetical protein
VIGARWKCEDVAACVALSIRIRSSADEPGAGGCDQHGGMAAVAKSPTGLGINREGALMVPTMNGTVGPQLTSTSPALYSIAQVAGRQEVDHEEGPPPARPAPRPQVEGSSPPRHIRAIGGRNG